MGMREECKHFQSRTYPSGEVARFCVLGNAPDQPWSCPAECITYEKRFADVGWQHGTLVDRPVESPPTTSPDDRADVLAAAAEIVNAIAPAAFTERRAQLEKQTAPRGSSRWKFWRR
jgi:hypothetical protein